MKKLLLTTVLAVIGSWVWAQLYDWGDDWDFYDDDDAVQEQVSDQKRIAVFPFVDMDKVFNENQAFMFYQEFSNEFKNRMPDRSVVPRLDVERLITIEANFQLTDFSTREKTAEMNRVLNGNQILSGYIAKVENKIRITVSLYTYPDLDRLPGGVTKSVSNITELFEIIPELIQDMQNEIAGRGTSSGRRPPSPPPPNSTGAVFRQEGVASWYGPEFDGRPTASGEIFNSTLFTAAHPSLPFGTLLLVTNKQNNRQITVKVNDRGPFVAAWIIDLSKAAAEHLDMIAAGTAPVIVETTMPGSNLPTEPYTPSTGPGAPPVSNSTFTAPPVSIDNMRIIPALPSPNSGKTYRLLVGTYPGYDIASHVYRQLQAAGFQAVHEQAGNRNRVFAVGIPAPSVYYAAQRLGAIGFAEVWVQE